jgi:TolB-like protein/Flp pilus assembly protein TadD
VWAALGLAATVCAIILIASGAWRMPRPDAPISIAVLPFANLSSDAEQEFFSDGITEEITSALARIPDLIVIGRTSAFQFKGQNKDLRAIGKALSAGYLIEGTVRKAGDRVRITAQLIRTDSGVHIWTENYERGLNDIFATQEDIARAIAASLRVPLGLPQGENLVTSRSIDPEAHEQYLRAKALLGTRGEGNSSVRETVALLETVVARAPNYAPAGALLALAHTYVPRAEPAYLSGSVEVIRRTVDASFSRAESEAQRAIELDAASADGYLSLARVHEMRGDYLHAEEFFAKALAADPHSPEALSTYANMLAAAGRLKEALAMKRRALALEPFVPAYNSSAAFLLWLNGQDDAAIAMLERMSPSERRTQFLAMMHASAGRYGKAADILLETPSDRYPPGIVEQGANLLRTAPSAAASPQTLAALGNLDFVYLHIGAADRVNDYSERLADIRHLGFVAVAFYWHPSAAPARKSERFKTILRTAGLVDYWRAKGWPEFCRPVGADDFACN